jgi:hypothetical protein
MSAPFSYNIDEATCTATVTYHSQPVIGEWRKMMLRLLTHAVFQPHFSVLLDRRQIYTAAETNHIEEFVRVLDDERERENFAGRCAIVVSDANSFGMGKMAEQLSSFANSIRTFYKMEEAERWIAEAYTPAAAPEVPAPEVLAEVFAMTPTQSLPLSKAA